MASVTHIIHNAWAVNFNLPLQAFEGLISGVRCLIEASVSATHPVKLLVTSSIGVASRWNPTHGLVPERTLDNPDIASANGYTASKYVTEAVSTVLYI